MSRKQIYILSGAQSLVQLYWSLSLLASQRAVVSAAARSYESLVALRALYFPSYVLDFYTARIVAS